mmetsp:Transcript_100430/g.322184  ORF Transcript_100430/g.322184 Transcript_100430/m.322184 type:complete len:224 (+) Transcript_100430:585-1256(+)
MFGPWPRTTMVCQPTWLLPLRAPSCHSSRSCPWSWMLSGQDFWSRRGVDCSLAHSLACRKAYANVWLRPIRCLARPLRVQAETAATSPRWRPSSGLRGAGPARRPCAAHAAVSRPKSARRAGSWGSCYARRVPHSSSVSSPSPRVPRHRMRPRKWMVPMARSWAGAQTTSLSLAASAPWPFGRRSSPRASPPSASPPRCGARRPAPAAARGRRRWSSSSSWSA